MTMVVAAETPPLAADAAGIFRVGGSRVTLDSVVRAFHDGATAEEIAEQYPTISLGGLRRHCLLPNPTPPKWMITSARENNARQRFGRPTSGSLILPEYARA